MQRVLLQILCLIAAALHISGADESSGSEPVFSATSTVIPFEGDSPNTFTYQARLSGTSAMTVSVEWFTMDGTAIAGLDYTPAKGTLIFPSGVTNAGLSVTVLGDMLPDTNRTFYIVFTNAVNAVLGTNQLPHTIRDDDSISLPPGFSAAQVATNLRYATAMAFAPDRRIFYCTQEGRVRVNKNGVEPVLSFARVTVSGLSETGLLGIAFDPGFTSNNFVYVYYTVPPPNFHNRVSRFTAAGDWAVPGSERVILEIDPGTSSYVHQGGAIHFGPDGKLYIAAGDHGARTNAQRLESLFGKILRINPDGTIPEDNPFYQVAHGVYRSIWALGLRNPFSFAIHPQTGRMLINDVGDQKWEELNEGVAGANYGWPLAEGPTNSALFMNPLYFYPRDQSGQTCAIVGAAFYNPTRPQFPSAYLGNYFFSDHCGRWIRRLTASNTVELFCTNFKALDIKVGPDGALYNLVHAPAGRIVRISYGPRFRAIRRLPNNQVIIHAWGNSTRTHFLDCSSNLVDWQPLATNSPSAAFDLSDPLPAIQRQRFYRIREEAEL